MVPNKGRALEVQGRMGRIACDDIGTLSCLVVVAGSRREGLYGVKDGPCCAARFLDIPARPHLFGG